MKCLQCGKELTGVQKKYCSTQCQRDYEYWQKIQEWREGTFNGMKNNSQISGYVRRYMLEKSNYKCELCGWGEVNSFTGTIPLEIHHKDGDYTHTTEDNLQVLCPNCHSLTDNYRGANRGQGREDRLLCVPRQRSNHCIDCGILIADGSTRCRTCAGKAQQTEIPIDRETLKNLIRKTPFATIAETYNVSDNAIRRWCQKYSLPKRKMDINSLTDDEWALL